VDPFGAVQGNFTVTTDVQLGVNVAQLQAEIAGEQRNIYRENLYIAFRTQGQKPEDFNLGAQAEASGYRSPDFTSRSLTFQNIVNEMEANQQLNFVVRSSNAIMGMLAYVAEAVDPDAWKGEHIGTVIMAGERLRTRYVLQKLREELEEYLRTHHSSEAPPCFEDYRIRY